MFNTFLNKTTWHWLRDHKEMMGNNLKEDYKVLTKEKKVPEYKDHKETQDVSLSVGVSCSYVERKAGQVLIIHPWINGMQRM